MRKDLPEQAPVMSFFSRPIPNSHQVIDTVNCLKSNIDVYSAYNNEKTRLNFGIFYSVIKNRWSNIATQWNSDKVCSCNTKFYNGECHRNRLRRYQQIF